MATFLASTMWMFDHQYPNLAAWILNGDGWIELGQDEFSRSLVRILDIGGMIWESNERYKTVAEALAAAELALSAWVEENLSANRGSLLWTCTKW